MICKTNITDDLINDCSVQPVMGLKSGVIINYDDVDWAATTLEGSKVTDLVLKSDKTGYKISWLKRLGSNNNNFVASADAREGFTHSFACQLGEYSADNAERMTELASGKFLIVAESNFKGADNKDAFKVFGVTAGLYLSEGVHSSNENSGALTYVVSTQEGDLEKYIYNTLSSTTGGYDADKASFDSLFAAV